MHAVREVAEGRPYIDPSVRTPPSTQTQVSTITEVPATENAPLTTAEEQVLRLIATGWTHQRIAEHLSVDVSVVLALRGSAMQKAGLATRTQIINYARLRGWLEDQ